jgi:hypothetical protein
MGDAAPDRSAANPQLRPIALITQDCTMKTLLKTLLLSLAACASSSSASVATTSERDTSAAAPGSALAAATALAGHYSGMSAMYFVDVDGTVKQRRTFTEDIDGRNPVLQDGKAFISVTDTQTYDDGTPPKTVTWTEGFYVNADGTPGAHYFHVAIPNVTLPDTVEQPLAGTNGAATFDVDATFSADDLGFAGKDVTYAKQTYVKNVVTNGAVETDVVTEVTTIEWKDATGALQTKQFVSMNGTQSRTLPSPAY